jgi:hypothetical protein
MTMSYEPTPEEVRWIERSGNPAADLMVRYAAGANRLDPELIRPLLARNCTYGSQAVLEDLTGKKAVMDYLSGKFETLKEMGPGSLLRVQLAYDTEGAGPCLLYQQRFSSFGRPGIGEVAGYQLAEVNTGKRIKRLFLVTAIPSPSKVLVSGLFPGVDRERILEEINYQGPLLPLSEEVSFVLFMLRGNPISEMMEGSVSGSMEDYPGVGLELVGDDDFERCGRHGITALPTLDVTYRGETVRRIEGLHDRSSMRLKLADLFGRIQ